jgi:MarR family transcriptional regulator for hemolysin
MVPLDERFTLALHGGARAWRLALERRLKARGLTGAGWSAVSAIAACAQPPSQRELARQLGVDGATLVSTIDRLAANGLVERQQDAHDRRVKQVVLTVKGRALADEVQGQEAALRRLLLARLDSGQVEVAAGVLEALQQLLEAA